MHTSLVKSREKLAQKDYSSRTNLYVVYETFPGPVTYNTCLWNSSLTRLVYQIAKNSTWWSIYKNSNFWSINDSWLAPGRWLRIWITCNTRGQQPFISVSILTLQTVFYYKCRNLAEDLECSFLPWTWLLHCLYGYKISHYCTCT